MSRDIFNDRIARINNRTSNSRAPMATGEGLATAMFSSPVTHEVPTARGNLKPILLGLVLGMIAGLIAGGLENPALPWGPGFDYNEMIRLPAVLALVAGPVLAIAACPLRNRYPGFFFGAAAYFPAVIGAALIELPLF
ncbi:hypothetical protein [Sulfitobacter sp. S190]|uniref:hypothetical protein n=1 Tax=Sulfitobacter sp. S190 TaxID=2867022 RepID=UPI0021A3D152|nr:hypothetical protein [Sulfitobacter sp. S190]UWR20897.1 hypothetical protein K3756_09140 [Sulfitobacter sp. S190]